MSTKQYSVWPVMVTPYNLPPWLSMKTRFIWLTILIPGPSSPKKRLDIYLRPLFEDLVHLWSVGVETYDASRKHCFNMRATLMWTVSDFPAYAMLSGWSTQGETRVPMLYGGHEDIRFEERKESVLFWLSSAVFTE
ncbi:unnamed protein product [Rhodiola kirilowii]